MGWGSRNIIFIGLYWRWWSGWHTNHSYRSDTRGYTHWKYHTSYLQPRALGFMQTLFSPLVWSPQPCGIFQAGVEEERRTNLLRTKWGAVPPCHHKTEVITAVFHDWHPQSGLVCVANIFPEEQCVSWEGGFQQMLNYQAGCWRQFPLLGRVWEKFSLVWHFILQNYSTLRLRDKPWFMTD